MRTDGQDFHDPTAAAKSPSGATFHIIRGDAKIEYCTRAGFSLDTLATEFDHREAERCALKWYDDHTPCAAYSDWEGRTLMGNILQSTNSRYMIRCTSDIVPSDRAGRPVVFSIPLCCTIWDAEQMATALEVAGVERETVVLKVGPRKKTLTATKGRFIAEFHALRVDDPKREECWFRVAGILHVRVYPQLLLYGGRMTFTFFGNCDLNGSFSVLIGSRLIDVSKTDVAAAWAKSGLTEEHLDAVEKNHWERLYASRKRSCALADHLRTRGKVEVFCSQTPMKYDRGEGRVQAYPGNPAVSLQFGKITGTVHEMAQAVIRQIGRRFSLFRYQHHRMLWDPQKPHELDRQELPYFDQWMEAARDSADEVMLNLGLGSFMHAYINYSENGARPLPADGMPGWTWDDLIKGHVTAIRHAKKICPPLRVIQMMYEFDNRANTECHRDAHYNLFKAVYRAVHEVNKDLAVHDQLKVAGLGLNTPSYVSWKWDYARAFLKRYQQDPSPEKRLDFLTWHTYIGAPAEPKGYGGILRKMLADCELPETLPVIIDEAGLCERANIEDGADLAGAAHKNAAMGCFSAALHNWYLEEGANFLPISGAGWSFNFLTYGKQHALSPYAKAMVLRSRLADLRISSTAMPMDEKGYGLYSFATMDATRISALVWSASMAVQYPGVKPVHYPQTQIVFNDLPSFLQGGPLKATIQSSEYDHPEIQRILTQEKCWTVPLGRNDGDRHRTDFTPSEIETLNAFPARVLSLHPQGNRLAVTLDVRENGMYLVTIERP